MDLMKAIAIAASGLRAQSGRMQVISENIANADSTPTRVGGDPYRRQIATFQSAMDSALGARIVKLGPVKTDRSDFRVNNEPGHPVADVNGNVKYPNVDPLIETTDLRDAQHSYTANLNVIGATRAMLQRTLDILKS
jgi:flagellar basal-body rod protein FlgC